MNRAEMINLYRRPFIYASYQVSVHFAKRFQREIFQKLTNQKQELPVSAMFVNGSGQNEQSFQRTFHRCFLPSFGSFGQAVSEENIFQKSANRKPVAVMFVNRSGRNEHYFQRTLHRCFLLSFSSFWPCSFRGEDLLEIGQSETRIACGGHAC